MSCDYRHQVLDCCRRMDFYSHCLSFDNSDRKFFNSLTLVEILKKKKKRHVKDISNKYIWTKIDIQCFWMTYLPKALNKDTISCRLSWNDGLVLLVLGMASICLSENRIFSAVPRPWVFERHSLIFT